MAKIKGLFYFLLVNILISAITTLLVLWYWDSRQLPTESSIVTAITVIVAAPSTGTVNQLEISVIQTPDLAPQQPVTMTSAPLEIQYYQVQAGDNLSKIAVLFKADMDDIMRLNDIEDPNSLFIGQVLKIPGSPLPTLTPQSSATSLFSPTPTLLPATPTSTRTLDPTPGRLAIDSVLGAGVLQLERVRIAHTGGGTISLEGWQLVESSGHVFTFPRLELFSGSIIYVNTRTGTNTPFELFWGLEAATWEVGEQVILRDAQGTQRATFVIP